MLSPVQPLHERQVAVTTTIARSAQTVGFFRDLFGPSKPCDVCQLGAASWPSDRNGVADWKLRGHGLSADLLVCAPCYKAVNSLGLRDKNPMLAVVTLVNAGHASRPQTHAYLQHPEWRKIWMHLLETSGVTVSDDFQALAAVKTLEARLFETLR